MKKIFLTLMLVVGIFFSSCSQEFDPKKELSMPLRITAHLEGTSSVFTTDIYENGSDIYFDTSHSLFGTEIHFSEDGNTAKTGDFERSIKDGTFPAQESLIRAIKALNGTDVIGSKIENGQKYTIDEMTIMVYYDESTKHLTGIETEENGRRFDFVVVGREPYEVQSNGAG